VANAVSRHVDIPPDAPILEMMKDRVVVEMFLAFGILVAPFAEEFYFRGLLYPALQRSIGTVAAVLITSILFALMHASQLANSLGAVVVLLVVGILLTTIRARTGSLAAPFIVHFAYNSALFLGSILSR
jgi:membrane protease YdiL (CAAX protease family)